MVWFSFLVCVLFQVVVGSLPTSHSQKPNAEHLFSDFVNKFNKTYESTAQKALRFNVFKENIQLINHFNLRNAGPTFGITKFADLTPQEFKANILSNLKTNSATSSKSLFVAEEVPTNPIDWRTKKAVTPVKDQGQCGSAFVIVAAETVESANAALGRTLTVASVNEIAECALNTSGCNGGDPKAVFNWVIEQGGLESDNCYGSASGSCHKDKCPNPDPNLKLKGVTVVPRGDDALYAALTKCPVFVCVDASNWQMYTGGIFPANECSKNIDHCVQLVGYSPNQGGYWILKNSWGEAWGMDGYIYLQYGKDACGISEYAMVGNAQ